MAIERYRDDINPTKLKRLGNHNVWLIQVVMRGGVAVEMVP